MNLIHIVLVILLGYDLIGLFIVNDCRRPRFQMLDHRGRLCSIIFPQILDFILIIIYNYDPE